MFLALACELHTLGGKEDPVPDGAFEQRHAVGTETKGVVCVVLFNLDGTDPKSKNPDAAKARAALVCMHFIHTYRRRRKLKAT